MIMNTFFKILFKIARQKFQNVFYVLVQLTSSKRNCRQFSEQCTNFHLIESAFSSSCGPESGEHNDMDQVLQLVSMRPEPFYLARDLPKSDDTKNLRLYICTELKH
jgi:hypothetical protein